MKTRCKICGKEFSIRPSTILPTGNYCSRACHKISRGSPRPERKTGVTKNCAICGVEFYVTRRRADKITHCSRKCKGIASRLPTKQCAVCGKTFRPRSGQSQQPCCSLACGHLYRRKHPDRQCVICQTVFHGKQNARFCSTECANKWQARNKTAHACKVCGQTFYWSPSRSKGGNRKITYCSLKCRDADPERIAQLRQMNLNQMKLRPNNFERAGYAMLDAMKVCYKPQWLIAEKICVDAFVPNANLVVQFDGDYWHGNPAKFAALDKRQAKRVALDKSQDAYLAKCGYQILRIWESDLKNAPDEVIQRLASALQRA